MSNLSHYPVLAEMFWYPTLGQTELCSQWRAIAIQHEEYISEVDAFIRHVETSTLEYREEYYISTFDVQPLCCLDVGYTLFGEDYRRGRFMAKLKEEHRKAGNDCRKELPDNLPVLMSLLPKLTDQNFIEELVCLIMYPAVMKIISGFKSDENHYKSLLKFVAAVMTRDFPDSEYEKFVKH